MAYYLKLMKFVSLQNSASITGVSDYELDSGISNSKVDIEDYENGLLTKGRRNYFILY